MKKLKEKGMLIVSTFFMVSALLPSPNIFLGCAMGLWIIVLIFYMKDSDSVFLRYFYLLLIISIICASILIFNYIFS